MCDYIVDASVADIAKRLIDTNFAGTILAGVPEDETESGYSYGLMFDDGQCHIGDDMPDSDQHADNGLIYVDLYRLDEVSVIVTTGESKFVAILPRDATVKGYVADMLVDEPDVAIAMTYFGYDDGPAAASPGDKNVRIWCRPYYLRADYVYEDPHNGYSPPLIFATYEDAQNWIDDHGSPGVDYLIVIG